MKQPFPLATLALIAASVAVYLAELAGGGIAVCQALGFTPAHPSLGTAVLSMWLHDPDHVAHIAGNMLVLAIVGAVVEPALGRARLVALFVASGFGGALMHFLVAAGSEAALVGASGSIAGLMAVSAVVRPRVMVGFVVSFIGMNLVGLYMTTPLFPSGVSVGAHIGGFSVGALLMLLEWVRQARWAGAGAAGT